MEIKVLPPTPEAVPRTRSVLRRFSHFQKLHHIVSSSDGAEMHRYSNPNFCTHYACAEVTLSAITCRHSLNARTNIGLVVHSRQFRVLRLQYSQEGLDVLCHLPH